MQQLAVAWLVEQMRFRKEQGLTLSLYDLEMFAKEAEVMELEQKRQAYDAPKRQVLSHDDNGSVTVRYIQFEEWYEKTFKQS